MRKNEYQKRRKEIETEKSGLVEALAKVEAKLAALDLVWTEVYKGGNEPCDPVTDVAAATAGNGDSTQRKEIHNGHAQELIDEAAGKLIGEFGVKEVEESIHANYSDVTVHRTTIAGRLRKLADEGKLDQVQIGIGRRAGKFKGRTAA